MFITSMTGEMADFLKETLDCRICLDLLKDPVTVSCGHSFCMRCLQYYWDNQNTYSCPHCRRSFRPRPKLGKNTMLAAIVEELRNSGLQEAPADLCYARAEDVASDFCLSRMMKAFKSCLVCLAIFFFLYFCHIHMQLHCEAAIFKTHKLVNLYHQLQDICFLSCVDEHKGHKAVTATERADLQIELEVTQQEVRQRIQDGEKNVKVLQKEVTTINISADKAVEHNEKIFTVLNHVLEKRHSDATQQIQLQQEVELSRVKERQEMLEQEIVELRRPDGELQQLSHIHEETHALRPLSYFTDLMDTVFQARDKLLDVLRDTWTNISQAPVSEPRTRAELLQFSLELTLDPNTAHRRLVLSEGNRRVTVTFHPQMYPCHLSRFAGYWQVLSNQGLTGRCYWEVELTGDVYVAVAYKTISRAGGIECWFGGNDQSWSFQCHRSGCTFWYNNVRSDISGDRPSRIGVFLDHRAGVLSFYSVCGTTRLLHRVQTTFTQPLYAGIGLWSRSTAEVLKINK